MSQDIVNENQKISYTNLDFSSIYTEVLSLIKQLTYRWDPSIADESDPGVILVKLSAIIADKCNYNIDKSILEAFPLSVTQEDNARQLYEQLGYYMNWYRAATVPVAINWTGEIAKNSDNIISYTIPKFTTITDNESSVVYSIIGAEGADGLVVSDSIISTDGQTIIVQAMEGTPVEFRYVNNEKVITPQMVDPNTRRLYFSSANVAENGIFIKNTNQENYAEWKRVDNLYEQVYNELRYKFGYDSKSNLCYIEFPDNYDELFGSGIEITYLILDPVYSNIPAQTLSQFISPLSVASNGTSVVLDASNVKIVNYAESTGRVDKENLNDAYVNYKKTVGTFKTLITLRDYLNYIRNEDLDVCSNAFVCDRTNDIQTVYKIMSKQHELDTILVKMEHLIDKTSIEADVELKYVKSTDTTYVSGKTYFAISSDGTQLVKVESTDYPVGSYPKREGWYEKESEKAGDALKPFSLKFYLLRNAIALDSKTAYNETFEMMTNDNMPSINALLEDTSHLEHTYEPILPIGQNLYKATADEEFSNTKSYYLKEDDGRFSLVTDYKAYIYSIINANNYTTGTITPQTNGWYVIDGDQTLPTSDETAITKRLWTGSQITSDYYFGTEYEDIPATANPKRMGCYVVGSVIEGSETVSVFTLTTDTTPTTGVTYYIPRTYCELGTPVKHHLYELEAEAVMPHIVFFKNIYPVNMSISTFNIVDAETQKDIMKNVINALYVNTNSIQMEFGEPISLGYLEDVVINSDSRIKNVAFDSVNYTTKAIYYDDRENKFIEVTLNDDQSTVVPTMTDDSGQTSTAYENQEAVTVASFKKDILAKSILAGVSQLLIPDDVFVYHLSQKYLKYVDNISNITSEAVIDIRNDSATTYSIDSSNPYIKKTYTLKDNEVLTLFRPELTDTQQFLNGIHYEYVLFRDIEANQSRRLEAGEYIIFYSPITDDSGAITGYEAYACTEGIIIKPTFTLVKQESADTLSNYARTKLLPEVNSIIPRYEESIYNEGFKTEIRNSPIISNNAITGTDYISIQTLNEITINRDDNYKFFWVLNKPDYSNNSNIKTYSIFGSYDSENGDNSVNSYTLRAGEYLYYIDNELKNLAILSPGTQITRNCGVLESATTYTKVENAIYYASLNDLMGRSVDGYSFEYAYKDGVINPFASGFYKVIADPSDAVYEGEAQGSPFELGLYKAAGNSYQLTSDETFTDDTYYTADLFERVSTNEQYDSSAIYYILLMRKPDNYYVKKTSVGRDIYDLDSSLDNSTFQEVDTYSDNEVINPNAEGLYEMITNSNNYAFQDSYSLNVSPEGEFVAPVTIQNRFVITKDTNFDFISRKIFRDEDDNFDLTNTGSYSDIVISNTTSLSPVALGLFTPTYRAYYKLDSSDYIRIDNVDYLSTPYASGWYIKNGDDYELAPNNNPDTPEILSITPATTVELFNYMTEPSQVFSSTDYSGYGYFYRPNTTAKVYYDKKFNSNTDTHVTFEINAADITSANRFGLASTPMQLFYSLFAKNISTYSSGGIADFIKTNWNTAYTYNDPTTWATKEFELNGDVIATGTTPATLTIDLYNKFIKVESSVINSNQAVALDAVYPAFEKVSTDFNNTYFFVSADQVFNLFGGTISSDINLYEWTGDYKQISQEQKDDEGVVIMTIDDNMRSVFPGNNVFANATITLYYLPNVYKIKDFCTYTYKKYYSLRDYYTKHFGTIEPWTCTALTNDDLAANPVDAIGTLWKGVQYNTSITINRNNIWSFSAGDAIIFTAKENSELSVNWPIFSNTVVPLDLSQYTVEYQRVGEDKKQELDTLNIKSYTWRGYSNLLLNTSSKNGQKLESNHRLELYSSGSDIPVATIPDDVMDSSNVMFQLKYPVSNKSGAFIDVSTTDTLGDTIYNSLYAYEDLPNGDNYTYASDYSTYLYYNRDEDHHNSSVILPANLAAGNYLLPINTLDDVILNIDYQPKTSYETVDGEYIINITAVPDTDKAPESESGLGFGASSARVNYLHSYSHEDVTNFEGDRYYYVQLDVPEYVKVNLPSVYSYELDKTPAELKWYEYDAETNSYNLSVSEDKGSDLIEAVEAPADTTNVNPMANLWYEIESDLYVPTEDTTYTSTKTYYKEKEFFIPQAQMNPTLNFIVSGLGTMPAIYIVRDIFKYNNNPNLSDSFEAIKKRIIGLDEDDEYNYTFTPEGNDLIVNPLDPKSFWNSNHVYNKFIIPQLDFDNLNYKFITTKK